MRVSYILPQTLNVNLHGLFPSTSPFDLRVGTIDLSTERQLDDIHLGRTFTEKVREAPTDRTALPECLDVSLKHFTGRSYATQEGAFGGGC